MSDKEKNAEKDNLKTFYVTLDPEKQKDFKLTKGKFVVEGTIRGDKKVDWGKDKYDTIPVKVELNADHKKYYQNNATNLMVYGELKDDKIKASSITSQHLIRQEVYIQDVLAAKKEGLSYVKVKPLDASKMPEQFNRENPKEIIFLTVKDNMVKALKPENKTKPHFIEAYIHQDANAAAKTKANPEKQINVNQFYGSPSKLFLSKRVKQGQGAEASKQTENTPQQTNTEQKEKSTKRGAGQSV